MQIENEIWKIKRDLQDDDTVELQIKILHKISALKQPNYVPKK